MIIARQCILDYRNRLKYLPPLQLDVSTLVELIRIARPEVEHAAEWWFQWGCIPEGPDYDVLIQEAAADVRACRAPGAPETYPELYIQRCVVKAPPSDVETEEESERKADEWDKQHTARRRVADWLKRTITKSKKDS